MKSIDPNHLVTIGEEGFYSTTCDRCACSSMRHAAAYTFLSLQFCFAPSTEHASRRALESSHSEMQSSLHWPDPTPISAVQSVPQSWRWQEAHRHPVLPVGCTGGPGLPGQSCGAVHRPRDHTYLGRQLDGVSLLTMAAPAHTSAGGMPQAEPCVSILHPHSI